MLRSHETSNARQELEESQALLRMASHISRLGAWSVDLASKKVHWSEEVFAIYELPGQTPPTLAQALDFYAPKDREIGAAAFEACARQGISYDLELQIVTAKGRRSWVRNIAEAVHDESGAITRVQGACQDISEKKAAKAREDELQDRLTAMLDTIGEGFIALDEDWKITYLNAEAAKILHRDREHALGQYLWSVFVAAVDSRSESEFRRVMSDKVAVTLVEYFPALETWLDVRAYPSNDGLAIHLRNVSRERSLEERFQQSRRLESVGQLTGGVAHDFNNLLTVILGNAELLSEQLADNPRLKPLATMVAGAAQQGAELTRSLLAFARRQVLEPRAVDVNQLVADMHALLDRTLGEDIEIEYRVTGGLPAARIDPVQLESALLNLCLNARDAMHNGGRLTIETAACTLDAEHAETGEDLAPGDYIMVAVSDTGCGFSPKDRARAFEPFFTTKEKGKGTGLGLSMVYGFVRQSGGQVHLYSEPGEGTTIKMLLPCVADGETVIRPAPAPVTVTGGREVILLVEDDAMVRRYARNQLSILGYQVIDAVNGPDALDILRGHAAIDLLFTDIVMPGGMNGRQLAEAAKLLRPGLKVLYTSGYTENAVIHHGRLDPGVQLLTKPYRRHELAHWIRQALDAA